MTRNAVRRKIIKIDWMTYPRIGVQAKEVTSGAVGRVPVDVTREVGPRVCQDFGDIGCGVADGNHSR